MQKSVVINGFERCLFPFQSSLEFKIRVQQVIEEAKLNHTMDAIRLCQKYFPSEFASHAAEISRVMTAVVLYSGDPGTISQQLSVRLYLVSKSTRCQVQLSRFVLRKLGLLCAIPMEQIDRFVSQRFPSHQWSSTATSIGYLPTGWSFRP